MHTLSIMADGSLWTWGDDTYGQVGNGAGAGGYPHRHIGTATNWTSVSAGYYHSVALNSAGEIWTFGENSSGQLGINLSGTLPSQTSPVREATNGTWSAISAGSFFNWAINSAGAASGCGSNIWGQQGDGTTTNRGVFTQLPKVANTAPVAVADSRSTKEDIALDAAGVLPNDTDADGDSLTASLVSGTSHGVLVLNANGKFLYTPDADYNGPDSFTYQAYDGTDYSNVVGVSIDVIAVNDEPSFVKGGDQTIAEDAGAQSVTGWATGMSAGPADESGQVLDFVVTNDNNALFSAQPAISADGTLTYTPAADANGSASVSVSLHDDGGTATGDDTSPIQTFTITITAVQDPPTTGTVAISPDPAYTNDTLTAGSAGFTDPDGDHLAYSYRWRKNGVGVGGNTATLDLSVAGNGNRGDTISVEVSVSDGNGGLSGLVTDSLVISNSAPTGVTIEIRPDPANTDSSLYVTRTGGTDADGDPILPSSYAWTTNGSPSPVDPTKSTLEPLRAR